MHGARGDERDLDSSGAKQRILQALASHAVPDVELPALDGTWIQYDDPVAKFSEMLESVGGRCVRIKDRQQLDVELAQLTGFREARKICSTIPGIWQANVALEAVEDPHELADLDFALVRGEFAVAENGAVWITDRELRQRVVLFIARHLAVVVPAAEVLSNMHEAYARLAFPEAGFGLFLSGPSKTADIEQSLVIGAHGARSLHVMLVDEL